MSGFFLLLEGKECDACVTCTSFTTADDSWMKTINVLNYNTITERHWVSKLHDTLGDGASGLCA